MDNGRKTISMRNVWLTTIVACSLLLFSQAFALQPLTKKTSPGKYADPHLTAQDDGGRGEVFRDRPDREDRRPLLLRQG